MALRSTRRTFPAAAGTALAATSAGQRGWSGQSPLRYPDPDIVSLDRRFDRYGLGNTPIQRLHAGKLWAESPAWSAVGCYLPWSDVPDDLQLRCNEEVWDVVGTRLANGRTLAFDGVRRLRPGRHGRRHPQRPRRQHLVLGGLGGRRRRRGPRPCAQRRPHRPGPAPGDLLEPLLWRPEAEPAVHDRQTVALHCLHRGARRAHHLNGARSPGWCRPVTWAGGPPIHGAAESSREETERLRPRDRGCPGDG